MNIIPIIPMPNIFSPGPVGGNGSNTIGVGCVSKIGTGLNTALPELRLTVSVWDVPPIVFVAADEGGGTVAEDGAGVAVGAVEDVEVDDAGLIVTVAGVVVDNTFSLV